MCLWTFEMSANVKWIYLYIVNVKCVKEYVYICEYLIFLRNDLLII